MNKDRRKALERAMSSLEDAKLMLMEASEEIEVCKSEEQDAFDNMPEAFQQGDRGQAAEAAISEMDDAISSIESAIDSINNASA